MLRVNGTPIRVEDARTLVDLLLRTGRAADLTAADLIETALKNSATAITLAPASSDAVLRVLDDPPAGLVGLRGALARDHRSRRNN